MMTLEEQRTHDEHKWLGAESRDMIEQSRRRIVLADG